MCPFQWEWGKGLCCGRIFKDVGKKWRNDKQEKGKEGQRNSPLLQGTEIQQLTKTGSRWSNGLILSAQREGYRGWFSRVYSEDISNYW